MTLNKPSISLAGAEIYKGQPYIFQRKNLVYSSEVQSARVKVPSNIGLESTHRKNKFKGIIRGMSSIDVLNYGKSRIYTNPVFGI